MIPKYSYILWEVEINRLCNSLPRLRWLKHVELSSNLVVISKTLLRGFIGSHLPSPPLSHNFWEKHFGFTKKTYMSYMHFNFGSNSALVWISLTWHFFQVFRPYTWARRAPGSGVPKWRNTNPLRTFFSWVCKIQINLVDLCFSGTDYWNLVFTIHRLRFLVFAIFSRVVVYIAETSVVQGLLSYWKSRSSDSQVENPGLMIDYSPVMWTFIVMIARQNNLLWLARSWNNGELLFFFFLHFNNHNYLK